VTKKKLEFNIAAIYTASKYYDQAKAWLDKLAAGPELDSILSEKHQDIAALYTKIGNFLATHPHRLNQAAECYTAAGEYYAKVFR
jgi:tetratricopeptide (TPR) repeat protein